MKRVGEIIKEERLRKGVSLRQLEKATKIKREFLQALEMGDWAKLPEYPILAGFVKNISQILDLSETKILAFLRRDYFRKEPPKKSYEVQQEFVWTPKHTFFLVTGLCVFIALFYLIFQYFSFIKPPSLIVDFPQEGEIVKNRILEVRGRVSPDAVVYVNNQPALVQEDGSFTAKIEVSDETYDIFFLAESRSGKKTSISRKIKVDLED